MRSGQIVCAALALGCGAVIAPGLAAADPNETYAEAVGDNWYRGDATLSPRNDRTETDVNNANVPPAGAWNFNQKSWFNAATEQDADAASVAEPAGLASLPAGIAALACLRLGRGRRSRA